MEAIAVMIHSDNLNELRGKVKALITILMVPKETDDVKNAFVCLSGLDEFIEIDEIEEDENEDQEEDTDQEEHIDIDQDEDEEEEKAEE